MKTVRNLLSQFKETQLYHISRKDNREADVLAQQAVEGKVEVEIMIAATTLKSPQFEGMESLEPIIKYILEGEFPTCFNKEQ